MVSITAGFRGAVDTVKATGIFGENPKAWLDRVRAGGLTPQESRALVKVVYVVWLIALLFKALGSGWDVAWHFRWLRDDFAPPHDVNLIGDGIVIVLVLCHWYTRFAVDKLAFRMMAGGIILFVASAPIDVINHRVNGLDITAWSITHFGLFVGTAIMIAGAIRGWWIFGEGYSSRDFMLGAFWFFFLENALFPNQHQEYGVREIASWDAGKPYAEPSLLSFMANQIHRAPDRDAIVHFSLPIPAWVYPSWIVGVGMLILILARRSVGLRWTATTIAIAYIGWRCIMWVALASAGFPHSAVPYLLIGGAIVIDLVILAELPPAAEAFFGALGVTLMIYFGAYAQTKLAGTGAPPISYWSAPYACSFLAVAWLAVIALGQRRTPWDLPEPGSVPVMPGRATKPASKTAPAADLDAIEDVETEPALFDHPASS